VEAWKGKKGLASNKPGQQDLVISSFSSSLSKNKKLSVKEGALFLSVTRFSVEAGYVRASVLCG